MKHRKSGGGFFLPVSAGSTWLQRGGRLVLFLCRGSAMLLFLAISTLFASAQTPVAREALPKPELVLQTSGYPSLMGLALGSDRRYLVSFGNIITIWDLIARMKLRTIGEEANSVSFSPEGRIFAAASSKGVKLLKAPSGRELRRLTTEYSFGVAFSPDGRWVASGSKEGSLTVWEAATGRKLQRTTAHTGSVLAVGFSPNGRWLASGSSDKTIKIWDVATGQEIHTLTGHSDVVTSVAFSPNGRSLASGSSDKTVKLWDVATWREVATLSGHTGRVGAVAISADGRWLASGSDDSTVRIWDLTTKSQVQKLSGFTIAFLRIEGTPDSTKGALPEQQFSIPMGGIAFSADGSSLAATSFGVIPFWELTTGKALFALGSPISVVWSLVFTGGGSKLTSLNWPLAGNYAMSWDIANGQAIKIKAENPRVHFDAVSPDGRWLAQNADLDVETLGLFEISTGRARALTGHTDDIGSTAFSPDSRWLASRGGDGTVRLWDLASGREVRTLSQRRGEARRGKGLG
jgi:WD40 repeat protein